MPFTYEYPHPAVTVDTVLFSFGEDGLEVLLIERKGDPFKGAWAIPGGFVDYSEGLDAAAQRELEEETGIKRGKLEQIGTFGEPGRDPRERIITVVYMALVRKERCRPKAGSDASDARWFKMSRLPKLAFDHKKILKAARSRLEEQAIQTPILFKQLSNKWSLEQARDLYEQLFRTEIPKRQFSKALREMGAEQVGESSKGEEKLYTLRSKAFKPLRKEALGIA